jgi:hypothetical protein
MVYACIIYIFFKLLSFVTALVLRDITSTFGKGLLPTLDLVVLLSEHKDSCLLWVFLASHLRFLVRCSKLKM